VRAINNKRAKVKNLAGSRCILNKNAFRNGLFWFFFLLCSI